MGKNRRRKKSKSSNSESLNLLKTLFSDNSVVQLPKEPKKDDDGSYQPKPYEQNWRDSPSSIKNENTNGFKKWHSSDTSETTSTEEWGRGSKLIGDNTHAGQEIEESRSGPWERGAKLIDDDTYVSQGSSESRSGPWERGSKAEAGEGQSSTLSRDNKTWSRGGDVPNKFNIWKTDIVSEKNKSWKNNTTFIGGRSDASGGSFWGNSSDTVDTWR
jgi:hypothetical protein